MQTYHKLTRSYLKRAQNARLHYFGECDAEPAIFIHVQKQTRSEKRRKKREIVYVSCWGFQRSLLTMLHNLMSNGIPFNGGIITELVRSIDCIFPILTLSLVMLYVSHRKCAPSNTHTTNR